MLFPHLVWHNPSSFRIPSFSFTLFTSSRRSPSSLKFVGSAPRRVLYVRPLHNPLSSCSFHRVLLFVFSLLSRLILFPPSPSPSPHLSLFLPVFPCASSDHLDIAFLACLPYHPRFAPLILHSFPCPCYLTNDK